MFHVVEGIETESENVEYSFWGKKERREGRK